MEGIGIMQTFGRDLRHAVRTLRKSPVFTAVAVLSLALGIGANTAIFELLDAVRLRSLPVPNPEQLAEVRVSNSPGGMGISHGFNARITNPLWEQIRDRQQSLRGAFAFGSDYMRLGRGAQATTAHVMWVSGSFFPVLEVPALRGRVLSPEDDRRGCGSPAAVVSYNFWQSHFGGSDSAIGSTLILQDQPFQVVGVTPPSFFGPEVGRDFGLAVPLCSQALWDNSLDRRDVWWLTVMGRLQPGWTLERATAQLSAISPGLMEATTPSGYGSGSRERYQKLRLAAYPAGNGISSLRQSYDSPLWLLLAITGLVLLIACANLANLILARAGARGREIALRLALGASRSRLVSQLCSESIVLAAAGTLLGAALAGILGRAIVSFVQGDANRLQLDLAMDWRILVFMAAVAVVTCLLCGLAPALRSSRLDPAAVIKSAGRGLTAGRERFWFQRLLVVAQVSVSLVLVVGALLFVRSFHNLATLDPGFRTKGILFAFVDLSRLHLPVERREPYQRELLDRIRALPQVEAAGTTTNTLLNGSSWTLGIGMKGLDPTRDSWSKVTWVSPGYLKTMEIALLAGRDFDARDTRTSPKSIIVNQAFVRDYLGGADPIGKTVRTMAEPNYPETEYTIVGVVRDTKYSQLRDPMPPSSFIPASQIPNVGEGMNVVIRTSGSMSAVISSVRQAITAASSNSETGFVVFEDQIRQGLVRERLMAALSGFFGALAAILAAIGLYGVISYMVLQRRNEIGIRLALGATRGQVLALVFRNSGTVLAVGIAIGAVASLAAARSAASLLYGLQPDDPSTLIMAAIGLTLIALLASYLPARSASRVDPMVALRDE